MRKGIERIREGKKEVKERQGEEERLEKYKLQEKGKKLM